MEDMLTGMRSVDYAHISNGLSKVSLICSDLENIEAMIKRGLGTWQLEVATVTTRLLFRASHFCHGLPYLS